MFNQLFTAILAVLKSLTPTQLVSFRVSSSTFVTDKRKNVIVDKKVSLNLRDIATSLKALCTFISTNEDSAFEMSVPEKDSETVTPKLQEICTLVASLRNNPDLTALPFEYTGKDGKWTGYRVGLIPITADDIEKQMSSL